MTWGASTMAVAAVATIRPPTFAMNWRRSVIPVTSPRDELVVGALGHVVPRAHQRLKLRERGVDLPGHRRLLGFLLGDLGGQLLEIAQHRRRELDHLDLALEFRFEPRRRDSILVEKVVAC